ncbi:MAG TPA: type II secretion system protein, partial [Afipia sp.]|nr:type II secretion system protein [Afipia sp.]
MVDLLIEKFHDARFMTMLMAAIAAAAAAYAVVAPMFAGDGLAKRMKAVASERERMRQRERDRLNRNEKVSLRQTPKQVVQRVVDDFNLGKWVAQEEARDKLVMAGYRGQAPYVTFLFFRLVMPIVFLICAILYVFVISNMQQPTAMKIGMCLGATWLGMQAPMLFLKNAITKRQLSIRRAFPDALDLLLICIESGMSIEAAFRRVSQEIGSQSIALGGG